MTRLEDEHAHEDVKFFANPHSYVLERVGWLDILDHRRPGHEDESEDSVRRENTGLLVSAFINVDAHYLDEPLELYDVVARACYAFFLREVKNKFKADDEWSETMEEFMKRVWRKCKEAVREDSGVDDDVKELDDAENKRRRGTSLVEFVAMAHQSIDGVPVVGRTSQGTPMNVKAVRDAVKFFMKPLLAYVFLIRFAKLNPPALNTSFSESRLARYSLYRITWELFQHLSQKVWHSVDQSAPNQTDIYKKDGYWVHEYKSSGVFNVMRPMKVDVFVVGGGGGGGYGGGGGGYTATERGMRLRPGFYNVVVGEGGEYSTESRGTAMNGSASSFDDIRAPGGRGGRGGGRGGDGGSGGANRSAGGGCGSGNTFGGSDGQNGGGGHRRNAPRRGGGRGQGTSTRAFGDSDGELYGGGGSSDSCGGRVGNGGEGGGGHQNGDRNKPDGLPNTGGGGGGKRQHAPGSRGKGGSGIVMIRYKEDELHDEEERAEAEGGDLEYQHAGYQVHVFRESGEFDVTNAGEMDVLVVAGGGGGGGRHGGGGGAGGLLFKPGVNVSSGTHSVVVGRGGRGGSANSSAGENGENSSVFDIEAIGGGGGGAWNRSQNGRPGGSGGGNGKRRNGHVGSGIHLQGNDGGRLTTHVGSGPGVNRVSDRQYNHGGGGGAGGPGEDGIENGNGRGKPGNGGQGRDMGAYFGTDIGDEGWFSGGGAGGWHEPQPDNYARGGKGGGGSCGVHVDVDGHPAKSNTGGGGGAGSRDQDRREGQGGDGGSGIVVIRYRIKGDSSPMRDIEGALQQLTFSMFDVMQRSVEGDRAILPQAFDEIREISTDSKERSVQIAFLGEVLERRNQNLLAMLHNNEQASGELKFARRRFWIIVAVSVVVFALLMIGYLTERYNAVYFASVVTVLGTLLYIVVSSLRMRNLRANYSVR